MRLDLPSSLSGQRRSVLLMAAMRLEAEYGQDLLRQDRRVRDLVAYLETLRGPYGLWQHPTHPQLSCWLSFDLKSSLRRLGDGDWVGNEEPVSFTPYRRGRRRY
jgi:hypothetical protein